MIKIIFCRSGTPCSDFEIENITSKLEALSWEYGTHIYKTSTHLLIDSIRSRMKRGTIREQNISFEIEDLDGNFHNKPISQNGRSMYWYDSETLMDSYLDILL